MTFNAGPKMKRGRMRINSVLHFKDSTTIAYTARFCVIPGSPRIKLFIVPFFWSSFSNTCPATRWRSSMSATSCRFRAHFDLKNVTALQRGFQRRVGGHLKSLTHIPYGCSTLPALTRNLGIMLMFSRSIVCPCKSKAIPERPHR